LRATRSRECAPDDRLHEAIQGHKEGWIASSQELLAMTTVMLIAYHATGFGYREIASVISAATMHNAPAAKKAGR
jgi:hypothetical protein